MDTNQPENCQKGGITKSQKRHQKKVAKRKAKKEERKAKQLQAQANSGKLIEENHNGGLYSPEFTAKAALWYIRELSKLCVESRPDPDKFIIGFRGLRPKLQTLLLKWSDDLERTSEFWFIMELLDRYRADKNDSRGLFEFCNSSYLITMTLLCWNG